MIAACRSCGSDDIRPVLSLGSAPLANRLPSLDASGPPDPRYPLDLCVCAACSLAQLSDTVPPEVLFHDYPYLSSFSDTMIEHARGLAAMLIQRCSLDANTLVLEIGSNDGYLLQHFAAAGIPVLGIDPARDASDHAKRRGVPTRQLFFGAATADGLIREGIRPRVIVANNVLAHVPDVNDVVSGVRRLLSPDGVFVIETPYIRDLIDGLEFDTIYHEHVFYYSFTALARLLARHDLMPIDVDRVSIHGGSIRTIARAGASRSDAAERVLQEETEWGACAQETYANLAWRIAARCRELRDLLLTRKRAGRRLAAYGAAAKGVMLLHALGAGHDVLDFVVDRSPRKQGRRMPGADVPILAPAELLVQMPDDVLLLTWNLRAEILEQQAEYRRRGGTFIIPLPELQIV